VPCFLDPFLTGEQVLTSDATRKLLLSAQRTLRHLTNIPIIIAHTYHLLLWYSVLQAPVVLQPEA
jgi:hypothetical protein